MEDIRLPSLLHSQPEDNVTVLRSQFAIVLTFILRGLLFRTNYDSLFHHSIVKIHQFIYQAKQSVRTKQLIARSTFYISTKYAYHQQYRHSVSIATIS